MKKVVVTSVSNTAGMNIVGELGDIAEVHVLNSPIVELEGLERIKADLYIVVSTHRSEKGVPCLTAHAPGNFGKAELGGRDRELSIAPALYISEAVRKFKEIKERENLPYEVSLEVTHHGPSYNLPILFVEVGSSEREWRDVRAIKAAAEVVKHLLDFEGKGEAFVGVGGPHYAPNFTKLVLAGFNFGHICPKYAISYLDMPMFQQMIEKTFPKPEGVVIDWKGTPREKRKEVVEWADRMGIKAYREKDLKGKKA